LANSVLDPITGVLNRNGGLQAATRLVAEATGNMSLATLWLDLDRFQQINKSFGHSGGDRVIASIASRIRSAITIPCEISRMGSDEFVCLVPGLDLNGAERLARQLLRVVDEPLQVDDLLFRPSVSIGIAIHSPEEDSLALLERSDRAMIEAKRQGGNCIVVSGEEPVPGRLGVLLAREELGIESDLHTALETGGLLLNFQPIVGFDGRIEAFEALMRCNANGRQISPGKFIPVAEKTGLIVRLGEWCLLQGARYAARLQREGIPSKVAINVSRLQLTSPKFLQAVHGALICADVAPELIELELTESLFMDLSETVQANLRAAREIGMGLAIDDFGTGYSCLSTIKDLPATKLKLDRAFVCVLPEDRRAFAVVKAMTRLAQDLDMIVVAEGVETQGQMDALKEAGVNAIQGFFYARPMAEDVLLTWLHQRRLQ
jgi:diguanylate cyclase (GGDEF)-like protein